MKKISAATIANETMAEYSNIIDGKHREFIDRLKPTPPSNLWDQINTIVGPPIVHARPEGSFTRAEFEKHYGLSQSGASNRIKRMTKQGLIKKVGLGHYTFYTLVTKL